MKKLFHLPASLIFCVLLICRTAAIYSESGTVIRAGITREITDYDAGSGSTVLRGGLSYSIDNVYRFNFTAMQNRESGDKTGTWFIQASPEDKWFSILLGNYSLHFGSGLLMGKKEFIRPDPFSRRLSFSRDDPVSGSESGNPAYSFFGIAPAVRAGSDDLYFRLVPFCSVQRRYISEEQVEDGAVSSSLMTVNLKTVKNGRYDSPADILNRGAVAETGIAGLFHVQAYCFSTTLETPGGKEILWEKTGESGGISRTVSCGIFAGYSDENISVFVEPVRSSRSGPELHSEGGSIAGGVSLRNRVFSATLNTKFCQKKFRPVYSSGDSGPENIIDFSGSVGIGEHLKTGAAIYSERDLTVVPGSDERRCFIREEALASITGFRSVSADFKFSRKLPLDCISGSSVRQGSTLLDFNFHKWLYLRTRCTGQFCQGESSWLWGCELKLMLLSYFSLSAGYTGIHAVQGNPLYAALTPASENNMDINRFTSDGNGWSVKLKYSRERDSFFFRWCRSSGDGGTGNSVESAGVLFF